MAKKVSIKGLKQLERKLGKLPGAVDKAARQAVADEVSETADDERRLAPRRTGHLIGSVVEEIDPSKLGGSVYPSARYATFVNDGARGVAPQPFATAAAKLARKRFKNRVVDLENDVMRRLGKGVA